MKRRHAGLVSPARSSVTCHHGAAFRSSGTRTAAASGPGHGTASRRPPAASHSAIARRTVARAPITVATEPIPAVRSGPTSCTAPKACAAVPHRKKAVSSRIVPVPRPSPSPAGSPASRALTPAATAKPTTAGLTKCVLEVIESRNGLSLNRSPFAEYATTAKALSVSHGHDGGPPAHARNARNGTVVIAEAHRVARCSRGGRSAPSIEPLRGLARSEA